MLFPKRRWFWTLDLNRLEDDVYETECSLEMDGTLLRTINIEQIYN